MAGVPCAFSDSRPCRLRIVSGAFAAVAAMTVGAMQQGVTEHACGATAFRHSASEVGW
jgi:hypothetical protein